MNTTPNSHKRYCQNVISCPPPPKSQRRSDNHLRIPKPILKWVGGKTQILNKIMPEFPVEMDNYVEPFWAAGGPAFSLTYVKEGIIKVGHIRLRPKRAPDSRV
jgi:hypothetical protein